MSFQICLVIKYHELFFRFGTNSMSTYKLVFYCCTNKFVWFHKMHIGPMTSFTEKYLILQKTECANCYVHGVVMETVTLIYFIRASPIFLRAAVISVGGAQAYIAFRDRIYVRTRSKSDQLSCACVTIIIIFARRISRYATTAQSEIGFDVACLVLAYAHNTKICVINHKMALCDAFDLSFFLCTNVWDNPDPHYASYNFLSFVSLALFAIMLG